MSDEANFQKKLLQELALLFDPLVRAGTDPAVADAMLRRFGWSPEALFAASGNGFVAALPASAQAVGAIVAAASAPPRDIAALAGALASVATAVEKLGEAAEGTSSGQPTDIGDELGLLAGDLLELVTLSYLARRAPIAVDVLRLLTVVYDETRPALADAQDRILRDEVVVQRLDLSRLGDLVTDPVGTLRRHYLPGGLATDADVLIAVERLYPALAWVAHAAGAEAIVGRGSSLVELPEDVEAILARTLRVEWRLRDLVPEVGFGLAARLLPADDRGPGVVLSPFGDADLVLEFGSWQLTCALSAEVPAILVNKDGIEVAPGPGGSSPIRVETGVRFERLSSGGPALRIGSATGTRLEVGTFAVEAGGGFADGEVDFGAGLELGKAALVIAGGDGDGFIGKILPPEGFRADFHLGLAWSRKRGVRFSGGASIDLTLPVKVALGPISIDAIHIAAAPSIAGLPLELSVTAGAKLGPLSAVVERVGLKATLTLPQGGGNLGPADVTLGFKPPSGIGLAIKAGPVTGGGYLYVDPDRGQYAGVAELSFKAFAFKAIGILNTKMPDGSRGFSLLVIITAEFPPIQLGYGFTLSGLGGLLGINRTSNPDALRAALQRGGLDSVMFPPDPVANAPQVISDLGQFFPIAVNRFVFGPMVALGWGSPQIIRVELGVVLDLPSPLRLMIMGKVICALPTAEEAVLYLRLDVLGIIDFDRGEVSVDASLVDSRVAVFTITGDMAMRLRFGSQPTFAISAGGFNPGFDPPADFPLLDRLGIALATGDNPRLRLESYFALTANTAQFGARAEVYFGADLGVLGRFSIEGHLGFDALFQFIPFSMRVGLSGGVALKRNGRNLFAVTVDATLEGPSPWHVSGEAAFEFLWAERRFPFDETFGEHAPPTEIESIDPAGALLGAFAEPGNWTAELPTDTGGIVTLRQLPEGSLLAHPLGVALAVRQRVLPLGVTLAMFGTAPIAGVGRFEIEAVRLAGAALTDAGPLRDHFAPAQFFRLTDDEKLARPSFEQMDAGRRLAAGGGQVSAGPVVETNFGYETVIIDEVRRPQAGAHSPSAATVGRLAHLGAAGRAELRRRGAAAYAGGPALAATATDTRYVVVDGETLTPVSDAMSQVEAIEAAGGMTDVLVVGGHEAAVA